METIVSDCNLSRHLLKQPVLNGLPSHVVTQACSCCQNSEIFTLTYGSIVRQLIIDLEDMEEVNKQLDTMYASKAACVLHNKPKSHLPFIPRGYNIGIRLIDEFLAKSKTTKCIDFRDTADKVAKVMTCHTSDACLSLHGVQSLFSIMQPLAGWFQDVP